MEIQEQIKQKLDGALQLLESVNDDINVLWHNKQIDTNSGIFGQMSKTIQNVKSIIEDFN